MSLEIWVVPFFAQGHLFPSMELCKHIASRNFKAVFVISSDLVSSVPTSFQDHSLIEVIELPSSPPPQPSSDPMHHHHGHHSHMAQGLEYLISNKSQSLPVCVVVDVLMSWSNEFFIKHNIPIIGFFTSGACSAAMEYAKWKANPLNVQPGKVQLLPGLPEQMSVTYFDLKTRPHNPPGGPPPNFGGGAPRPPHPGGAAPPNFGEGAPQGPHPGGAAPPNFSEGAPQGPHPGGAAPPNFGEGAPQGPPPGGVSPPMMGPPMPVCQPPWLGETSDSIALLINTCAELEGPFLEYLSNQVEKPVWGVGPLLPEQYWKSAGSLLHDRQIRTNRGSNVSEEDVVKFLDSKPHGSVLYVSFGSLVDPDMEEYPHLADALEASNRAFIWVIQPDSGRYGPPPQMLSNQGGSDGGYYPHGLEQRVGERGLIIHGWAPQLLILSHPSTGGFLSHCGWNSTVEAIGVGVPFLAWPIRGDQHYNAKLIVKYLKIGYMVCEDFSEAIKKEDIMKGIERLMGDEDVKKRATVLGAKFQDGFPISSMASLDAFKNYINQKAV